MTIVICILYRKRIAKFISTKKNKWVSNKDVKKKIMKSTEIEIRKLLTNDVDVPTLDEFEYLNDQERLRNHFTTIQGNFKEHNTRKIVNPILPYSHSKVTMKNSSNVDGFINASWVLQPEDEGNYDSISTFPYLPSTQVGIITMQMPDESNFEAVLQMIYGNDVSICLNISKNRDHRSSMSSFSSHGNSNVVQKFVARSVLEQNLVTEEWDFSMERSRTNKLVKLELNEFSLQSSDAIDRILRTITYVRKEMTTNRQQLIMLVQDENEGVSAAAIFVALLILLEKIDDAFVTMDSHKDDKTAFIDIFKTVNELRSKRMQMVQTFEDYQFLYQSVAYYVQNKNHYDELLMSKCVETSTFNIEEPIHEEDDIYLTRPEDVRRALNHAKIERINGEARIQSKETDIDKTLHEEDDDVYGTVYHTRPEDVRRALNQYDKKANHHGKSVTTDDMRFGTKVSATLTEEMDEEYVLKK